MAFDLSKTEEKVDRVRAGSIEIHEKVGGMMIETVDHLFRIADALSRADVAVPPHCRGNPNVVFAICLQAQEWGLPYMAVLNKSYLVNNRGVERIAYESQLVHTLIEVRANLTGKLREEYLGAGDEMVCRVSGTFRGEQTPHVWESEKLGKIKQDIGRNEHGKLKGSPLWDTRPRLQLKYATTRDWARAHCPWVILGVYTPEDFAEDVTQTVERQGLVQRLQDRRSRHAKKDRRGFDRDKVNMEVGKVTGTVIESQAQEVKHGEKEGPASGHDAGVQGTGGSTDSAGGSETDQSGAAGGTAGPNGEADRPAPGGEGAQTQDERDTFPPDRKKDKS